MIRDVRRHLSILAAMALAASTLFAGNAAAPAAAAEVIGTPVRTIPDPFIDGHAGIYGWGAATLLDGSVIMGDYWNLRVARFEADGTYLGDFINNPGYMPGQHQSPYGLGVDPVDGDVFMADTDRRMIKKYNASGTFIKQWGVQGKGVGKFEYPSRVAVGTDGRVYVADTWSNNIVVHDNNGTELFSWGITGVLDGQFKQPHGMSIYYGDNTDPSDDKLFVVDSMNFRVQVFDMEGNFLFKFGQKGLLQSQFKGDLRGLAIDQENGWVYIVDAGGNKMRKFDVQGNWILSWGGLGSGPGEFSDGGREATVDGDGNVWVGDMPNYRVQKFSPTGDFISQWPDPEQPPPDGGFNGPRGVALDAEGNMFVTDTYNQRIQKFDADGNFVTKWGERGRGQYSFNYARMLATDPRNGDVVVADTDNQMIKKYDNDGNFLWQVGARGKTLGKFVNPHGVDVGPDGKIYVADTRNFRVQILNENGVGLSAFGTQGKANNQFLFPRGIAVDPIDGSIWVTDASTSDALKHFAADGTFLGLIGGPGTTDDKMMNPFDVEVDANYVYVADTQTHKIKVWEKDGTFVTAMGSGGTALGQMGSPQGLDLGPDGHLYVAEQDTERIQEWQLDLPPVLPTFTDTLGGPGHADMYPSGLEAVPGGGLVVADTGNNQIKKYDSTGQLAWEAGEFGVGTERFNNPRDVGVDAAGNVYVADTSNGRIAKLDASGNWVTSWNTLHTPMGVTVSNGEVYVADAVQRKVRVYNLAGTLLRTIGQEGACTFSNIRDVDADSDGNLYIANYTNNNILKMSPTGACIMTWGTKGTGQGQFKNPYGVQVFVDPVLGRETVYVADSNNNRMQQFSTNGAFEAQINPGNFTALRRIAVADDGDVWIADMWGYGAHRFDRTGSGYDFAEIVGGQGPPFTDSNVFNEVRGIAFDSAGTIHAVDSVNQRVVRMSASGNLIDSCGLRGWTAGEFNWPRGVAIDPLTNEIWVADTKQSRLQIMGADCTAGAVVTSAGGTSKLNWPYAIAIRSDRIAWVVDTKNSRVVSYDVQTRKPLATFGSLGSGIGQFKDPRGIAVNPANGRILVADSGNNRIVELADTGGKNISVTRTITSSFKKPEGVAATASGLIYVADSGDNEVIVLTGSGQLIGSLTSPDGYNYPSTIAVDAAGRVLVADTYNDRIQVFTP